MAVTADQVVVRLEAQTSQYQQNIQRAERTSTSAFNRMQAGAARASSSINASLRGAAAGFAAVQLARAATNFVESATRIENSLKVVGLLGKELDDVYASLFESAQRNFAPLETLATLYGRLGLAQKELGATNEELLNFTDNVALALRVQGTGAQEARGALIQLSQAMGAGIVRAEEFNSIVEGAPSILRATAAGLEDAGGSVARLRQLVVDGKVSSQAFFRAFEAGAYILEERVAHAEITVSQGFVRLQNVLIDVAREMNEGSAISGVLVGEMESLGDVIKEVADFAQYAVGPISDLISTIGGGVQNVREFAAELGRLTGLEAVGAAIAPSINNLNIPGLSVGTTSGGRVLSQTFELLGETELDEELAELFLGLNPQIAQGSATLEGTFALLGETPQDEALAALLLGEDAKIDPERKTISLADYPILGGPESGKGRSSAISAAERERQAVLDLIDALEFERSQIGRTAREQAVANALRDAGAAATEEQIAYVRQLAEAIYDETEALDRLNVSAQEWADTIEDATRGFINDLLEGKDAAEAFSNVLKNVASQLINMGLNSIFGGGGLNLAGIFGGVSTRATGGPVYAGNPTLVGEKGPEIFIPSGPGKIVPNSQVGGGATVTYAPVIDARGADMAVVARLEAQQRQLLAEFEPRVKSIVRGANHNWRVRR